MRGIKIYLDDNLIGSAGATDDGNIALLLTLQIQDGVLLDSSEIRVMGYVAQTKSHREYLVSQILGKELKIRFEDITEDESRYRPWTFDKTSDEP